MTTTSVLVIDSGGGAGRALDKVWSEELQPVGEPLPPALGLEAVKQKQPALVLIEVREGWRPDDALKLVERVMSDAPRPIVIVVRTPAARRLAFGLLEAGALEVVELSDRPQPAAVAALRKQLMLLSTVKVVRHPRGVKRRTSSMLPMVRPEYPLVAVASSLGGPRALVELLQDVPSGFAAPVLICQHITPGFSDDLARWLAAETGHRVHEAQDRQRLVKGEFFVAPSHLHLLVGAGGQLKLDDGPAVGGFKPSCDLLLQSVAQSFGSRAIGVVLTGMGSDGARGLKAIREAGGHTIAQDEATSVVFGMPGAAVRLGAAERVLALHDIGAQLVEWVA